MYYKTDYIRFKAFSPSLTESGAAFQPKNIFFGKEKPAIRDGILFFTFQFECAIIHFDCELFIYVYSRIVNGYFYAHLK